MKMRSIPLWQFKELPECSMWRYKVPFYISVAMSVSSLRSGGTFYVHGLLQKTGTVALFRQHKVILNPCTWIPTLLFNPTIEAPKNPEIPTFHFFFTNSAVSLFSHKILLPKIPIFLLKIHLLKILTPWIFPTTWEKLCISTWFFLLFYWQIILEIKKFEKN